MSESHPDSAFFRARQDNAGQSEVAFAVSDVARASQPLLETSRLVATSNLLRKPAVPEGLEETLVDFAARGDSEAAGVLRQLRENAPCSIEACSQYHGSFVANVCSHPVMAAAHLAFSNHQPLVLSPDVIWLMIIQGFANHVRTHSESLRPRLVGHQGRISITVRRDDFVKGSPENPWEEVIADFESQVCEHLGSETAGLLKPEFSTTGAAERVAAGVVLLDALQNFFSLDFLTLCGIPEVILRGTTTDWEDLALRTRRLGPYELEWWTAILEPILQEFIRASRGEVDLNFWRSLYKLNDMSGGPFATGWLTAFFPYLWNRNSGRADLKNHWFDAGPPLLAELLYHAPHMESRFIVTGLSTDELPSGMSAAPFQWSYLKAHFEMEFLGGFVGVRQDAASLRLTPEIGWAIREAPREHRRQADD